MSKSTKVSKVSEVVTITPKATSDAQRGWLLKNGVAEEDIPATAFESMKAMDKIIAKQKKNRNEPPTDSQLRYLESEGYNRQSMSVRTKGYCSALIYKLKKQNNELKKAQ